MAYIGSTPTSQNFISGTDYFNGTGSQTAFTLTRTVNSVNDIQVVVNNVTQDPSVAYTLSGTTITFTSAPSSGTNNIYVRYLSTTLQSITVPANSVTRSQLDSNLQAVCTGRNRIINGHMVIDQRNSGSTVSFGTGYVYYLDRWEGRLMSGSGSPTIGQSSTAPAGFSNSLLITNGTGASPASGATNTLIQGIEGYNLADLNWGSANAKPITLSFWVRSSLTGLFSGSVASGASSRSYPFTYTINSANTWEQKSITIAGDTSGTWATTNTAGIYLWFDLGTGSTYQGPANAWGSADYRAATGSTQFVATTGATFYITGVQLEEGTQATSFERESYSVTLQKCQRYYQLGNYSMFVSATGASAAYGTMEYKVTARTNPTVTRTGNWMGSGEAGTTISYAGIGEVSLYNSSSNQVGGTFTISSEL